MATERHLVGMISRALVLAALAQVAPALADEVRTNLEPIVDNLPHGA